MATDVPSFAGRPDTHSYAVELRNRLYYPRSEAEREQFLLRPREFLRFTAPSRINVNPAIAVSGPPLSGKTSLAKQLALRTGAVYISIADVVGEACACPFQSQLSRSIAQSLRQGKNVGAAAVQALRHRLAASDVLSSGWVLDDFPHTVGLAEMMTNADIVPHRLFVIGVPPTLVFARARMEGDIALQMERLEAYNRHGPLLRAYYSTFDNVFDLDGTRSAWAIFDAALAETSTAISQRLRYYRRTSLTLAASVRGLGFTPSRLLRGESPWKRYCPVTLTLSSELEIAEDPRHVVEHKSKIYWMVSGEYAQLFENDPESFLQVPLPHALPVRLALSDKDRMSAKQLEGYCPVAVVDRDELVLAGSNHVVQYKGNVWACESKEACAKFMRRPLRYVQRARLPPKKPAVKEDVALLSALMKGALETSEMLTYMQTSVAEIICQALVESGRRPLLPGKSAEESVLLFLARFIRARNTLSTEMCSAAFREQLDELLGDCALPEAVKAMTKRKRAEEDTWTPSDTRRYDQLCARFDEIFDMPFKRRT